MRDLDPHRPPLGIGAPPPGTVTRASMPIPVTAWLAWPDAPTTHRQVGCHAVAWTRRTVLIRWLASDDDRHELWVWVGQVARRPAAAAEDGSGDAWALGNRAGSLHP